MKRMSGEDSSKKAAPTSARSKASAISKQVLKSTPIPQQLVSGGLPSPKPKAQPLRSSKVSQKLVLFPQSSTEPESTTLAVLPEDHDEDRDDDQVILPLPVTYDAPHLQQPLDLGYLHGPPASATTPPPAPATTHTDYWRSHPSTGVELPTEWTFGSRTAAERMPKDERDFAQLPRVAAYCTGEGYDLARLRPFLREHHHVSSRQYDEALYAAYHFPLMTLRPDKENLWNIRVRSASPRPPAPRRYSSSTQQEQVPDHDHHEDHRLHHHHHQHHHLQQRQQEQQQEQQQREQDDERHYHDSVDNVERDSDRPPSSTHRLALSQQRRENEEAEMNYDEDHFEQEGEPLMNALSPRPGNPYPDYQHHEQYQRYDRSAYQTASDNNTHQYPHHLHGHNHHHQTSDHDSSHLYHNQPESSLDGTLTTVAASPAVNIGDIGVINAEEEHQSQPYRSDEDVQVDEQEDQQQRNVDQLQLDQQEQEQEQRPYQEQEQEQQSDQPEGEESELTQAGQQQDEEEEDEEGRNQHKDEAIQHINRKPFTGGEVFIFDYGVVVFWNFRRAEELLMLEDLAEFSIRPFRDNPDEDMQIEEMHFQYDTSQLKPRIFNDMITMKTGNHMIKLTLSHGLSQSALLARYEDIMDKTIEDTKHLPKEMAETGRLGKTRAEITKINGQLFNLRMNVNLVSNVLDTPEIFWSEPALQPMYNAIREYLEIPQRAKILNDRLKVISDLLSMLRDHLTNFGVEYQTLIIIYLIIIAVIVACIEIAVKILQSIKI